MLTTAQAAVRLGVSITVIHRYYRQGRLPGAEYVRDGRVRRLMIPEEAINDFQPKQRGRPEMTLHDKAIKRVLHTPELEAYEDIIINYDWPDSEEHIRWVLSAPVQEIVDWAAEIRKHEDEAAETDAELSWHAIEKESFSRL